MKTKYFTISIILLFFVSLSSNQINLAQSSLERDYWPTDSWQYATFEEVGMNENRIVEMFDYIDVNNMPLTAF